MRKLGLTILAGLLATGAYAQDLAFAPPEGFEEVHASDSGALRLREFRRAGASAGDEGDGFTLVSVRAPGLGAEGYAARVAADLAAVCGSAMTMTPDVTGDGDRASALGVLLCPNMDASGRSEVGVLRVVDGEGGWVHAIQRTWAEPPPEGEILEWSDRLRALPLCDAGADCR